MTMVGRHKPFRGYTGDIQQWRGWAALQARETVYGPSYFISTMCNEMRLKRLQMPGVGEDYKSSGDATDLRNFRAQGIHNAYYPSGENRREPRVARLNRTAVGASDAIVAGEKQTEDVWKVKDFDGVNALLPG